MKKEWAALHSAYDHRYWAGCTGNTDLVFLCPVQAYTGTVILKRWAIILPT